MRAVVFTVLVGLGLLGCADDLPKATEIARMRVLGAQLSVVGDKTRTTPKPGESVRVHLPVVFPSLADDRAQLQTLLITCTAPDRFTGGLPICQELIDAAQQQGGTAGLTLPKGFPDRFECNSTFSTPPIGPLSLNCARGEPDFTFVVPKDYAADELLFAGVVCEQGKAVLDPKLPGLFGCQDNKGEAIALHGLVHVQYAAGDANHNPDLGALRIELQENGEWSRADPATLLPENEASCSPITREDKGDRVLPGIVGDLPLQLLYDGDVREEYMGEPEPLELTVYATAGELERRFTLFDASDEGELHDTLHWRAPDFDKLPDGGQLVRFFVTVRDERGGFGMANYALCSKQSRN